MSMLKQDSIAEESPLILCDQDGQIVDVETSDSIDVIQPAPTHATDPLSVTVPDVADRKGSLSPNGFSSHSLYSAVISRRKGFQRTTSNAQSDVTETVARERDPSAVSPVDRIGPCASCENTNRIRFDFCSSASSLKSNGSSVCRNTLPVPTASVGGGGSLRANGFVPASLSVHTSSALRDPGHWHLSVTKQRSHSESAFNMANRPQASTSMYPSPLAACPEYRRCSVAILNPAREQAILRRILGPSGLSWLSREHIAEKKASVHSEDVESQRPNGNSDDSKTPLMKQEKNGRLVQRHRLFHVRRLTSCYALFLAIFGIVMMIVENELCASGVYDRGSFWSVTLKSITFASTVVLVGFVIKFQVHEIQVSMNANCAEDWRIVLTPRRLLQFAIEVVVCAFCPLPFDVHLTLPQADEDGERFTAAPVPLDVLLSIPMFFRLYWIPRVLLLRSKLFTDISSRGIAGLNRVDFDTKFISKTLMTLCPGTMLMVLTASLWVVAACILRLCERQRPGGSQLNVHAQKHENYLNSLWMIAITFLSIGYGDIVPYTYCGRTVAVVTGLLGTCASSMVVAVIARKLELTSAEKHVHNFMVDTQLSRELKHSAANVLRETWLIYKHRRLVDKIDLGKIRHHQRKFLVAIYALRNVKKAQRRLQEAGVSLGDVAKTVTVSHDVVQDINSTQACLALRMTAVEHQLVDIQREISSLVGLLHATLKRSNTEGSSALEAYPGQGSPNGDSVRRRK
ncbi:Protein KCNL-2 c [Aphelenchoides avenae]|nr:Protein KCNL-2 c [Aphelenchus avenae]